MPMDVTTNSQYIDLKKSYDSQVGSAQNLLDLENQYNQLLDKLLDPNTPFDKRPDLQKQLSSLEKQIAPLLPEGRATLDARGHYDTSDATSAVNKLTSQETSALGQLSALLTGDAAVADADAAHGPPPDPQLDILMRCFLVMQKVGQTAEDTGQDFIADMDSRAQQGEDLTRMSTEVNNNRPNGSDVNAKGTLAGSVVDKLKDLGVDIPINEMTKNADGTYTMPQSTFDKITNDIKAKESSVTTMNQDKQTTMQGVLDFISQTRQYRSNLLEMKKTTTNEIVQNSRS